MLMDDTPIRVLLVDDDEDDYIVVRDMLRDLTDGRFRVDWVAASDEALVEIDRAEHDVYLFDYRLGECNGLNLLKQALANGCRTPIIILTGQGDRRLDLEAMRAGATDFLEKQHLAGPMLERSIRYAIAQTRTLEALRTSEAQLRQAQKMEAVARLAGGVAHDFNNLLTVINGHAELLKARLDSGHPALEHAAEIKLAGERAAALTRQLLTFSRKQIMKPAILDLNSLISGFEKMLARLIGEDIQVEIHLDPALGSIKADPGQIEQVIMNLAVNARDAMPEGGILTISTENVDLGQSFARQHFDVQPGSYVQMTVSDTGCGMDEETQSRLFEPFFTTKAPEKGTGLGLSTVYGIVKQWGGSIWLHSELGKGSTFKICLPRVEQRQASNGDGDECLPTRSLDGSETILLAEDDSSVRRIVNAILTQHGYNVLVTASAEDALELEKKHSGRIDLLLTDVVMPKVGGRELADLLTERRPDVRRLYMSGYTDDVVLQHRIEDSEDLFLQKPFTIEDVLEKVREALNRVATT